MRRQIKYHINTKPTLPSNILSPHHLQHSRGQQAPRRPSSWLVRRFLQREQRQLSIRTRRLTRGSVFLLPESSLMLRRLSEPHSVFEHLLEQMLMCRPQDNYFPTASKSIHPLLPPTSTRLATTILRSPATTPGRIRATATVHLRPGLRAWKPPGASNIRL
jgi:hypothetical protein